MTAVERSGGERPTLRGVQALRFLAAAMVLVGHVQDALGRGRIAGLAPLADPTGLPWHAGVDVFFVISGFVMCHVAADAFGRPGAAVEFLRRRLVRVAPLYWVFTGLAVATALGLPGRVEHDEVALGHVAASLAFLPWRAPSGLVVPPLSVGWTLNFEMLFYAVFAVGLLFRRTVGLPVIVAILAVLALPRLVAPEAIGVQVGFWGFRITFEFLYGIALARLFAAGLRLGGLARLGLAVAAVAALVAGKAAGFDGFHDRWIFWGVPAAMIVAAVVLGPDLPQGRWSRLLVLGGDASYALYLSHLFTLRGLGLVWSAARLGSVGGYVATAVVASVGVAVVVHLGFEKPLLARLRRRASATGPALATIARPGVSE